MLLENSKTRQLGTRLRSQFSILLCCLLSLGLVAACGSGDGGSKNSDGLAKISIVTFPGVIFFPDVVAQDQGLFKQNGLDAKFVKVNTGPAAFQLALAGDVAGLISDSNLPLQVAAQGQDVKIIGSVYNLSSWKLYAAKDGGLESEGSFPDAVQALKGKRIGVFALNGAADLALQSLLAAADVDPDDDVQRIAIGAPNNAVAQFEAKKIDVYNYLEPSGALFSDKGVASNYFDFGTQAPEEFSSVISGAVATSGKWLKKNPDLAKKWLASYADAIEWVKDPANRDKAAELFSKSYGGSVEASAATIDYLLKHVYPTLEPGLAVPQAALQRSIDLMVSAGALKSGQISPESISAKLGN